VRRRQVLLTVLWALLAVPVAGGEPAAVAAAFLETLREGSRTPEELLRESFISPFCGESKRRAILQRLKRLGHHLRRSGYELEAIGTKRDGPFAAVLVSAISRHDPLDAEIIGLGLREIDGNWRVAPVPGSFENCNLGFDDAVREKVDALALWMGRQRVLRLRDLQSDLERKFRQRMEAAVPDDLLRTREPKKVVQAFLDACRNGDLAAVMVLLGNVGLERDEADLELQRAVSCGLRGLDRHKQWRILADPNVIRVLITGDDGDDLDAEVVMLVFDPDANAGTKVMRFVLLRAGKRWAIRLPGTLRHADDDRQQFQRAFWREQDPADDDLKRRFPEVFEKTRPPLRGNDLAETGKRLETILQEGELEEFFRFLCRRDDLTPIERRVAYAELGQFWNAFREEDKSAASGELIKILAEGDAGVLVFHRVSTARFGRPKLKPLLMMRGPDGWAIAPGVTSAANYDALPAAQRKAQVAVLERFAEQRAALSKQASKRFLDRFVSATPDRGVNINPEAAADLVSAFRGRLRHGRLLEVFEQCALLDHEEGAWEALRSLSYEYRGAKHGREADVRLGVSAEGPWAGVSLRVDSGPAGVPDYPMYLVVATARGLRLVVDGGLRLAANKAREALNQQVWNRVDEHLNAEQASLVRKLFERHVGRSRKDLAKWEKNNKSSP